LELADEIGEVSLQLPALFGRWAGHHIAGTGSGDLAERYSSIAHSQSDTGPLLIGLRMLGLERFYEGRFEESLPLTQKGLDIFDPAVHHDLTHRFGHDPRAASANYKAWNLWHLGMPDQAARTFEENLRWTREVNHPNTTGLVLCTGTMTNIWLRRHEEVEKAAREALRLAEEMALALWHAWGRIHLGWALSQRVAESGLGEIEAGLQEARQIGAGRYEPFRLAIAADASRQGVCAEVAGVRGPFALDVVFPHIGISNCPIGSIGVSAVLLEGSMANDNQFAWDDVDLRDAQSVPYRQIEGAVAFLAVFATFAAAVKLFWT
jgi:hypothetical protein